MYPNVYVQIYSDTVRYSLGQNWIDLLLLIVETNDFKETV